jgi:hypothetical protein
MRYRNLILGLIAAFCLVVGGGNAYKSEGISIALCFVGGSLLGSIMAKADDYDEAKREKDQDNDIRSN